MSYEPDAESDTDSLFGPDPSTESQSTKPTSTSTSSPPIAHRYLPSSPSIPGLYFNPDTLRIPETVALGLLERIKEEDLFKGGRINQVMLFERGSCAAAGESEGESERGILAQSGLRRGGGVEGVAKLPGFLVELLSVLEGVLKPHLPGETFELLFPPAGDGGSYRARQAILNLYRPGEGITPHVDLLKRFGDGIMVLSLGSGTVMQLAKVGVDGGEGEWVDLWLEPRSVLVLEGEARYCWTHGIEGRAGDWVEDDMDFGDGQGEGRVWVERGVRVSITLRWLLPGAEVVGGGDGMMERA